MVVELNETKMGMQGGDPTRDYISRPRWHPTLSADPLQYYKQSKLDCCSILHKSNNVMKLLINSLEWFETSSRASIPLYIWWKFLVTAFKTKEKVNLSVMNTVAALNHSSIYFHFYRNSTFRVLIKSFKFLFYGAKTIRTQMNERCKEPGSCPRHTEWIICFFFDDTSFHWPVIRKSFEPFYRNGVAAFKNYYYCAKKD